MARHYSFSRRRVRFYVFDTKDQAFVLVEIAGNEMRSRAPAVWSIQA
jgi:hypothetical protein